MSSLTIDSFIEEANRTGSVDALCDLFGGALASFGYDRFCYSLITDHPSLGLTAGHGVVSNYPDDWMAHYKEHHYEKKDPVPRYGLLTTRPFTWDSLSQTYSLTPIQNKVMQEAREAKLLDGVAIPICGHHGELAGIGIASSSGGTCPDANLLGKLRALTLQFHLVYTELENQICDAHDDIRSVHLTEREKEILLWCAEGKSDSVIAEIIGISHATIRFHLNNIFKKLNANERTLATVKAIRHGLILPSYLR